MPVAEIHSAPAAVHAALLMTTTLICDYHDTAIGGSIGYWVLYHQFINILIFLHLEYKSRVDVDHRHNHLQMISCLLVFTATIWNRSALLFQINAPPIVFSYWGLIWFCHFIYLSIFIYILYNTLQIPTIFVKNIIIFELYEIELLIYFICKFQIWSVFVAALLSWETNMPVQCRMKLNTLNTFDIEIYIDKLITFQNTLQ